MHDLLEGIAPVEVSLILDALQMENYITLEDLYSALTFFNYSLADRTNRPPTLASLHSLKMSASEMWCFLRIITMLIGHHVPREQQHWKLLLLFLDITDIVLAPTITNNLSNFLSRLVEEHHNLFKSLFPDKRLIPKHHFLIYYSTCLKSCGPPVRYWSMRFEDRHQIFKEMARSTKCYKNICKQNIGQEISNEYCNQTFELQS